MLFISLIALCGYFCLFFCSCSQIPKQENIKTAESKITHMMYLKHTLELVAPFRDALGDCENPLLKASYKVYISNV